MDELNNQYQIYRKKWTAEIEKLEKSKEHNKTFLFFDKSRRQIEKKMLIDEYDPEEKKKEEEERRKKYNTELWMGGEREKDTIDGVYENVRDYFKALKYEEYNNERKEESEESEENIMEGLTTFRYIDKNDMIELNSPPMGTSSSLTPFYSQFEATQSSPFQDTLPIQDTLLKMSTSSLSPKMIQNNMNSLDRFEWRKRIINNRRSITSLMFLWRKIFLKWSIT